MLKKIVLSLAIFISSYSYCLPLEVEDTPYQNMCTAEGTPCEKEDCLRSCLSDGEDPIECPYLCYDQV